MLTEIFKLLVRNCQFHTFYIIRNQKLSQRLRPFLFWRSNIVFLPFLQNLASLYIRPTVRVYLSDVNKATKYKANAKAVSFKAKDRTKVEA